MRRLPGSPAETGAGPADHRLLRLRAVLLAARLGLPLVPDATVPVPSSSKTPLATLVALLLLILADIFVGARGLDVLLPHLPEPDAYSARQVEVLAEREEPQPSFFFYPLLMARLSTLGPQAAVPSTALQAGAELGPHLVAASSPWVRIRWVSMLGTVLAVPMCFLLARTFLSAWPALLAAAFMATAFIPSLYGAQGRPHGLALGTIALGLLMVMRLAQKASPARYLGAGLGAALAIGSLHSGFLILPALLVAHWVAEPLGASGKRRHALFLMALAVALLAMPAVYPSWSSIPAPETATIQRIPRFANGALEWGQNVLEFERFSAPHPTRWVELLFENEPAMAILAGLGLLSACAAGLRKKNTAKRRPVLALCAHNLVYATFLTVYYNTQDRYLLPLLPLTAVLAAYGATRLVGLLRVLPSAWPKQPFVALGALLVLAPGIAGKLKLAELRHGEDTVELAAQWIAEHESGEQAVGLAIYFQLPASFQVDASVLATAPPHWIDSLAWYKYLSAREPQAEDRQLAINLLQFWKFKDVAAAREALAALPCRYVLVELTQRTRGPGGDFGRGFQALRQVLREDGRLVKTFTAGPDKARPGLFQDYGVGRNQWIEFWRTENLGPRIQVFDLDPPKRKNRNKNKPGPKSGK
jgi:4-amino-4-deoxy-L-arabinose transferase-like glycosyltransferase